MGFELALEDEDNLTSKMVRRRNLVVTRIKPGSGSATQVAILLDRAGRPSSRRPAPRDAV
jgi:hypothetical protein